MNNKSEILLHTTRRSRFTTDKYDVTRRLKDKWKKHATENGYPFVIFMMTCILCGQSKERTPEFYHVNHGYDQLFTKDCGKEGFQNSCSVPCVDCYKKKEIQIHQTKKGFMQLCVNSAKMNHIKYIKTNKVPSDLFDIDIDFIEELLKKQDGRCIKTRMIMNFGCYSDFAFSIDRIDNSKGYTKNNIQLVCREVNVAGKDSTCGQTDTYDYKNIFVSIINWICYNELCDGYKNNFENNLKQESPANNGVTASRTNEYSLYRKQRYDMDLKYILKCMCSNANRADNEKGRIGPRLYIDDAMDILRKNDFLCYYSKIPLDIHIFSKSRFSFERLDNSKTHGEPGNCVPILRFLNCSDRSARKNAFEKEEDNGAGMSTKKLIRMILQTDLIELTHTERECLENELTKRV